MGYQHDALFLAGYIEETFTGNAQIALASSELRRLHAINAELLELLERAARRIEIEHKHGGSLMYEWLQEARSAIAKAMGEQQ